MGTTAAPMAGRSLETTDEGKPRFKGCVSIRDFELLGKLGEGTFGYAMHLCCNDWDVDVGANLDVCCCA
ncbi:hypothetical protein AAP_05015 [Ascosphaera apis ARSEF 7405]|uniref:Uncharacterized protein n=1 Tax=Ascosphaera apis ARSEF 7405 TaxID=392613 RepID=A0A162I4C7_9EURO|nr:hypothetical protein AAP_05015 [Ascosphaera apis ARSEF 7405]